MTKIDIIAGFLGAGKTSLIQKLLKEILTDEKVVLIENEFGEIGIDGGFLKDAGIQVTEMNSGCICCSLVGDFGKALKEVIATYAPNRIIIEPSGVGKLSDVMRAVKDVAEDTDIRMNSYTTVADAKKCKMYMKNFGEFYNNQIEHAGTIILSRTDSMGEEQIKECTALLREHNTQAAVVTTPWDMLTGEQLLNVMEKGNTLAEELLEEEVCPTCGCCHDHGHHHDHDHHADDVFTSWGEETPALYTKRQLEDILKKMSDTQDCGTILRSKGILPSEDGTWMYFDMVPGEYEIREGNADYTGRICVIGAQLKEEQLKQLFHVK